MWLFSQYSFSFKITNGSGLELVRVSVKILIVSYFIDLNLQITISNNQRKIHTLLSPKPQSNPNRSEQANKIWKTQNNVNDQTTIK